MNREENEDKTIYKVVVNHEEQYSIWPANRKNVLGWNDAGKIGLRSECLEYIKKVWTDMRPLSLRKKTEEAPKRNKRVTYLSGTGTNGDTTGDVGDKAP